MADFLSGKGGYSSESGAETDEEEKTELPQDYLGKYAKKDRKVSIKARPLCLQLVTRLPMKI